ncbi:MAG: flagellar biosynthesis protein FlhF, partial [Xanthomonadaceae bacterium]|nr:flagellar biosynthesis protein FlhF [Xanthomonadaceae bacterium]
MKIKRFVAADMRQAMQRVRDDQGPDAVILSSRRLAEGIEIIAAIDYDEALIREAAVQAEAQIETPPRHAPAPAHAYDDGAPAAAPAPRRPQPQPRVAP